MIIDNDVVDALADEVLGPQDKSAPPAAWGSTVREYLDGAPRLDQWQTPLLTLDRGRLEANRDLMAEWTTGAGVALAPHGKTTMAPRLWREQLVAGSWGITLATAWQAQLARSFGVGRIMLANTLIDPVGVAWAAAESARNPDFELYCWVDGVATVELMDKILCDTAPGPRVRVLVELGGPHGRTGARTRAGARAVAAAVGASERLSLAGVAGYEGALAHDRSTEGVAAVRGYLGELAALHTELAAAGAYSGPAVVTHAAAVRTPNSWSTSSPDWPIPRVRAASRPPWSCAAAPTSCTTTASTRGSPRSPRPRRNPACVRPCTAGLGWSRDPNRNWPCSTAANAISPSMKACRCPSRSSAARSRRTRWSPR